MISEEYYKKCLEEIQRFEKTNPLVKELDRLDFLEINADKLRLVGIDEEELVDYYHNRNLLALHGVKNSEGDEKEKYKREVERTHKISGYLERKYIGFPVDNSH